MLLKVLFVFAFAVMAVSASPVDSSLDETEPSPKPYSFGYDVVDEYGNQLHRAEVSDENGAVRGTYGYADVNGLTRQVHYVADHLGFRASVLSNEPGVESHEPASVLYSAQSIHSSSVQPKDDSSLESKLDILRLSKRN